jgi:hypothetical protein
MADQKITELTALTTVDDADLLAIVDDVAGTPETKKITVANLLAGAGGGGIDLAVDFTYVWTGAGTGAGLSTASASGGNITVNSGIGTYILYRDTALSGSIATLRWTFDDITAAFNLWDKEIAFQTTAYMANGSTNSFGQIVMGGQPNTTSATINGFKQMGFLVEATSDHKAYNDNDTSQTRTTMTGSGEAGHYLTALFAPGTDIKFYKNGNLEATHTTNLPTGARSNVQLWRVCVASNGTTGGGNNLIRPGLISINIKL